MKLILLFILLGFTACGNEESGSIEFITEEEIIEQQSKLLGIWEISESTCDDERIPEIVNFQEVEPGPHTLPSGATVSSYLNYFSEDYILDYNNLTSINVGMNKQLYFYTAAPTDFAYVYPTGTFLMKEIKEKSFKISVHDCGEVTFKRGEGVLLL